MALQGEPEREQRGPDDGLGARTADDVGELLGLCDEFFHRHAGPAVLEELRRFLVDAGHHPVAGLGAFLGRLGSAAAGVDTGRPRPHEFDRAAELTRSLAAAALLPAGSRTRDVGAYRALEVVVRSPGEYWATTDVVDDEGSGHLEVTVSTASRRAPVTLAGLLHPAYPGVTGAERRLPDGGVVTTVTMTSPEPDAVITQRAVLARPDGTYIDVIASNQDSRTGGRRTRPNPPLEAEEVLKQLSDLRP